MPTTYAIPNGRTVMDVLTWSGTGGSSGATRSITGLSFQPDLVWEKSRTSGSGHQLMDTVRGAGTGKVLASNSTGAEPTPAVSPESSYGWLSSFDSGGFTTTNGTSTWDNYNKSGDTYVAWTWKAGGAAVSNTDGSITSQVSANTSAGFSIVTYTGTGANATVGHGLGVAPKMVIIKGRDNVDNWIVYNANISNPTTYALILNSTIAPDYDPTYFNSTAPTSTVFSVGTDASTNQSTKGFVAYCWAEIAGFSKFGSYTGNSSADGPFVYLGFRPRFVLFKATTSQDWMIIDGVRDPYNVAGSALWPDLSNYENQSSTPSASSNVDFLSNGFKLRNAASGSGYNNGGTTYIYAAFAENPFKYANAR